jgi:hypothetical protein
MKDFPDLSGFRQKDGAARGEGNGAVAGGGEIGKIYRR